MRMEVKALLQYFYIKPKCCLLINDKLWKVWHRTMWLIDCARMMHVKPKSKQIELAVLKNHTKTKTEEFIFCINT